MSPFFDVLLFDALLVNTMFEDTIERTAARTVIEPAFLNNPAVKVGIACFLSSRAAESLNKRTRLSPALAGITAGRVAFSLRGCPARPKVQAIPPQVYSERSQLKPRYQA